MRWPAWGWVPSPAHATGRSVGVDSFVILAVRCKGRVFLKNLFLVRCRVDAAGLCRGLPAVVLLHAQSWSHLISAAGQVLCQHTALVATRVCMQRPHHVSWSPIQRPPPPSNSTERFSSGAGWEQILGKSYKEHQTNQAARLGRGKREKTQARNKDGGFQTLLRSGAEPAFVCPEPLARGPYLVVCCFLCYSMTSAALAGWTNEITPFATGRWLTVKRFSSIQPGFRLCVCLCVRMLCVGLVLTSAPHAPDCAGTAVRRGR